MLPHASHIVRTSPLHNRPTPALDERAAFSAHEQKRSTEPKHRLSSESHHRHVSHLTKLRPHSAKRSATDHDHAYRHTILSSNDLDSSLSAGELPRNVEDYGFRSAAQKRSSHRLAGVARRRVSGDTDGRRRLKAWKVGPVSVASGTNGAV
jgi:hypothetical protein